MIRFSLRCEAGHGFEGWFRDNATFDQQARRGLVTCPECGIARVGKAIMAPNVARRDRARPDRDAPRAATMPAGAGDGPTEVALLPPEARAMREMLRALRQRIEAEAQPVGDRFAEEARRIHEGEAPERAIYGSATPEEVAALHEDGIPFAPLPRLPDDRN